MQAVISYLKENQSRAIAELCEYVRFPSVSAQPQHRRDLRACAEWVDAVPENRGRAVDHRFNEQDSIKLVDVVLVDDRLIKPAKAGGDARRQLRTAAVEQICKQPSHTSHADGNAHEQR